MSLPAVVLLLQITVVTDSSWQGSESALEGWDKPGAKLDWAPATPGTNVPSSHGSRYDIENMFGFPSKAQWIVVGEAASCVLRRVIDVPKGFRRAELVMVADDVATLKVNGEIVSKWDTKLAAWGCRGGAGLVDLVPYLVEGKNVLGVVLVNDRGPWGFAAEIRIDGEPVVLPVRGVGQQLPADAEKRIRALVPVIDGDDMISRFGAESELMRMAEKHGASMLDLLGELAKHGSVEVRDAAERVGGKIIPDLDAPAGTPDVFGFGRFDLAGFGRMVTGATGRQVVLIRHLAAAKVLSAGEEAGFVEAVRAALKGGGDDVWERVVPYISFLEMKPLTAELVEAVKSRSKTFAGACAASALGRMGDKSHVDLLKKASTCGFAPTERAAKRAMALLKQ